MTAPVARNFVDSFKTGGSMSINATAVVKKETKVDPRKPNDKAHYASLSVLNEDGKEYGLPRYLSEFREVAGLLKREAGVTHEQLHERHAAYERGEEIRFPLTLESDEAIKNLGFDSHVLIGRKAFDGSARDTDRK
jgi:hypothetical protein